MKRFLGIIFILLLSFVMVSCDKNEEAIIKVKFCDSKIEDKTYFQGTYDLNGLKETGLSEFVPVKEGYKFTGWTLDINGSSEFNPNTYTGTEASLKVYAQWEELRKIVTYNGASILKTYYYDDLVSGKTTIDDATKNGYVFKGWTTDSLNEVAFDVNTYVYPTTEKSVKIFANFEIITTLSFYNQSELSYQLNLADIKAGTLQMPTPNKDGYIFDGWYLDQNFNERFDIASYVGLSSNVNLYAKFNQKPMVYYYDGTTLITKFYLENKSENTVNNPVKAGYDFVGWVDNNGNAFVIDDNAVANQNAYAKWEQKVTVNFYDGNTLVSSFYLDELTEANIPTVNKDTFVFKGWYVDSSLENAFDINTFTTNAKTVSIYAKLIKNTTIVFMNGELEVSERSLIALKDGTKTLPTVTKEGFIFDKWTLDIEGTQAFSYLQYTTNELTVNVYAQWTEKVKVNYYVENSIYDSKVLDSITNEYLPAIPTKEGYFFIKWIDENNADFILDVTSTNTLNAYPLWCKNPEVEQLQSSITNETQIVVSWTSVANTTYKVKLDNGEYASVSSASYQLPTDSTIGKHTVSVIATIYGHDSEPKTIEVIQKVNFVLEDVVFNKNTRIVSFKGVANAEYYQVKFDNDTEWTKVYTNEYEVRKDVPAGNYQITVEAYVNVDGTIIPSFKPATTHVEVVSIERITDDGLYINENDEYVLLAGVNYSFGTYAFVESDYYTLSNDNKTITPKKEYIGTSFTLTTTTSKTIKAYIAGYASSISGGSNWNYYKNASSINNLNNEETNKTGFMVVNNLYEVGTDDDDYILDIDVDGEGLKVTDYLFDLTGKVGGDTDIYKYLNIVAKEDNKYHIVFTAAGKSLEDGTIVELIVKPHYLTKAQKEGVVPSYTFKFKVNSGVNAYGYEDLKAKFADTNNKIVNMHQNINITQSMIDPNFGLDASTNNWSSSFIRRVAPAEESFILNGNYFKVDVSTIKRSISEEHAAGPGYTVYWVQVGVFCVQSGTNNSTIEANDKTYLTMKGSNVEFANLEIKGNGTLNISVEAASDATKLAKELLEQSGSIDGILTSGCAEVFYNCVISHTNEPIKISDTNSIDGGNDRYLENNRHTIDSCAFGDNWASSSYLWTDGYVEYKDCHLYNSSSVAIILADVHTCTLDNENAIEYRNDSEDILLANYPTVILNNTEVDNWVLGSEAYFTAYGMGTMIPGYKVNMENNISQLTSNEYTILNTLQNGYSQVNMVFQSIPDGDLMSYDIGYVKADGTVALEKIRTTSKGDTEVPNHVLAASDPYTVLFPLCDISENTACQTTIASITNELTTFGGYCLGQCTYDQFKALAPILTYVYTDAEIEAVLPSVIQADSGTQQAFVVSTLYKYAFKMANENKNGPIYVEVSMHSLTDSDGLTTIIIEGKKK